MNIYLKKLVNSVEDIKYQVGGILPQTATQEQVTGGVKPLSPVNEILRRRALAKQKLMDRSRLVYSREYVEARKKRMQLANVQSMRDYNAEQMQNIAGANRRNIALRKEVAANGVSANPLVIGSKASVSTQPRPKPQPQPASVRVGPGKGIVYK